MATSLIKSNAPADVPSPPAADAPAPEEALVIGGRRLPSRYFLSPLAGYTQLPYRRIMREVGGLGLATTDLVHSAQLLAGRRHSLELVQTHPDDRPLSVQLFGSQPSELASAARWLVDQGYEGIDLNMGCPMAKINGQGGGARLMCDATAAVRLVETVIAAVPIPVTVKMRLGWDRTSLTAPYLARQFEDAGIAAVTIHGRTRQQGFRGAVDIEGIAATVAAVRSIPVIGNGDVTTPAAAFEMRQRTGCAAVAIGRGALLDPWIFRKIADLEAGRDPREPTSEERMAFLRRHLDLMIEQHSERGCVLFRKFAGWYGACLGIPNDLEDRLRQLSSVDEMADLCGEIRDRLGTRLLPTATALIKVPNGPVEHW